VNRYPADYVCGHRLFILRETVFAYLDPGALRLLRIRRDEPEPEQDR
jgi:hypothetical protein